MMHTELEEFTRKLQSLNPAPNEDVVDALYDLVEPIEQLNGANEVIPEVFSFMERFPEADIGSPGPLVHFVERFYPNYLEQLIASLERQPTHHTLWMLNRILNSDLQSEQRQKLIMALRLVNKHPDASGGIKDEAAAFLVHQGENG